MRKSNTVAQQKITLERTPGPSCVALGDVSEHVKPMDICSWAVLVGGGPETCAKPFWRMNTVVRGFHALPFVCDFFVCVRTVVVCDMCLVCVVSIQ